MSSDQHHLKFHSPQVNLFVKDVMLSVKFYIENFGFEETFRNEKTGIPDHVELKLDSFDLAISSITSAKQVHNIEVGTGLPKGELVIWTENADQSYKRLIEHGASSVQEPHNFRNLRNARIHDLDQNLITIVSKRDEL